MYPKSRISVTQPRRVACTSVATYVSNLLSVELGTSVGYSVRFDHKCSPSTLVTFQTDGMLLRECTSGSKGRAFGNYDVVVVDEAHERSVGSDVLLGLLRDAQRARNCGKKGAKDLTGGAKELRKAVRKYGLGPLTVIVMSATISTSLFSKYFDDAPVLSVPGRSHAVDVLYTEESVDDYVRATAEAILRIHGGCGEGDVLAFLPGQEEIEECLEIVKSGLEKMENEGGRDVKLKETVTTTSDSIQYIRGAGSDLSSLSEVRHGAVVLPLYAKLPPAMQQLPFLPLPINATRRIVVSTNVAETSVTLPGVRYVVDCGLEKRKTYNGTTGVSCLTTTTITRASAMQRTGRSGRTGPGACIRLYTEESFGEMREAEEPEILRTSLENTVLSLVKMGVDVRNFDFIEPPSKASLYYAFMTLHALGALSDSLALTPHGSLMSLLPCGVHWSHMIVKSVAMGCTSDVLTATAMSGIEGVFVRPREGSRGYTEANLSHKRFRRHEGDVPTLVKLYKTWEREAFYIRGEGIGKGRYRQVMGRSNKEPHPDWCERNHINGRALAKANDVRRQLKDIVERPEGKGGLGATTEGGEGEGKYEAFLKCICEGLVDNSAVRMEQTESTGENRKGKKKQAGAGAGGRYVTTKGKVQVNVHPSSFMFMRNPAPQAVVFNEMMVTKKTWIRGVTQVRREWIEDILAEREGGGGKEGGGVKKGGKN